MSTSLKYTLNPGFALLFAVGVERLYKVLDPVILHDGQSVSVLDPAFFMPLTMVLSTLIFGSLSAIANDRFLEKRQNASATSRIAWFSYCSVFFALWMFYFSVDMNFVKYWWFGYAALCAANAGWNWLAIASPHHRPHVGANLALAALLGILLSLRASSMSDPLWFYSLLGVVSLVKWWQRSQDRFAHVKP